MSDRCQVGREARARTAAARASRPRSRRACPPGRSGRRRGSSTRSAIASAPSRWVTITIVRPREARRRLVSSASSVAASSALVASSSTRMRGLRITRAGDADQLALAGGEAAAALAELGLVALRQALDEVVRADELGGRDDPLERVIGGAKADVLGDRAGEQLHLLRHDADLLAQRRGRPQAHVEIVDQDAAARSAGRARAGASRGCSCRSRAGRPRPASGRAGSRDRPDRAPARPRRRSGRRRPRSGCGR